MDKFSLKMDLKRKNLASKIIINIIFIIALGTIIGINIFTFMQLSNLTQANKLVIHTYQVTQIIHNILLNMLDIESKTRGYLIANDKRFINKIDENTHLMFQDFDKAKLLTSDNPIQQKNLALLRPLLIKRINLIYTTINAHNKTDLLTSLVNNGYELTNEVSALLTEIVTEEEKLLQKRNTSAINNTASLNTILFVGNLFSTLLSIVGIIILNISFLAQSSAFKAKLKYENLLKGVIEGTNDIIVAIDKNFNFIIFNHSFEYEFKRLFGKRPLLGNSLNETIAHLPEQQEKLMQIWRRALNGEEFNLIDAFGDESNKTIYECNFSSIYDENGSLIGAASISRNIEERIEAEQSLKKTNDKLEKAYQELKIHSLEIALFNEMENNLQSCSSMNETLNVISIYCQKLLPFSAGVIYLTNYSRNYLEIAGEWENPDYNENFFSPDECWGLRQGKIYFYITKTLSILCMHKKDEAVKPYLCVPLLAQNEIIGMLHLIILDQENIDEEKSKALVEKNELLINNLATQLALAITNMKLRENLKIQSIHDPLTGLYNRAYLQESLEKDLQRAKRNKTSVGIVIMDVDHFKRFNDVHGHDAGDLVLKEVGHILQTKIRASDTACRYGGEEFLIILPETKVLDSYERMERLRGIIATLEINFRGTILENITASFGISHYPTDGEDMETLITAADQALYHSKRNGRNIITLYTEKINKLANQMDSHKEKT